MPGRVTRPFRAPLTRFGAGHLGVDFAAAPGTPVHASGPGTVVFAGVVAGGRHVVVRHSGGLRTSYSFLASIRVHAGEAVGPATVLGSTGGTGGAATEGHTGRVLHFGLRIGAEYVDPLQLFGPTDLAGRVHLAPFPAAARAASTAFAERLALRAGLAARSRPGAAPRSPQARAATVQQAVRAMGRWFTP